MFGWGVTVLVVCCVRVCCLWVLWFVCVVLVCFFKFSFVLLILREFWVVIGWVVIGSLGWFLVVVFGFVLGGFVWELMFVFGLGCFWLGWVVGGFGVLGFS